MRAGQLEAMGMSVQWRPRPASDVQTLRSQYATMLL